MTLDPEGFLRVRAAFEAALEARGDLRDAVLVEALGDAPALLAEARAMLRGHASGGDFLEPPTDDTLASVAEREVASTALAPGVAIGDFVLVRPIGSGGMGDVWEARQRRPERRVALKIMRSGFGSERSRRRFQEESEVLARLSHPSIAQVLASGVLAAEEPQLERPWFAMELIEASQALTRYASGRTLEHRLSLLRETCDAVHHGHVRGVIHRDLKPDNVLVDADGRVKVIDFGIARDADQDAARASLTAGGELLGTLAYMSPEQVRGDRDRIDVRTDVHALGVLLYELLTGRLPWRTELHRWTDLASEILERDALAPSRLQPELSRELDWIVARALAKDPERRYPSAQALADELRRFLNHQPLMAGPESASYQALKFARRHRAWVVGGAVAAGLLLLGTAGTAYGLLRSLAREAELEREQERTSDALDAEIEALASARDALAEAERSRAEAEDAVEEARVKAERAEQMNLFLNNVLRSGETSTWEGGSQGLLTVVDLLDLAADRVGEAFPAYPDLEAQSRVLLGLSYSSQGQYSAAVEQYEQGLRLYDSDDPAQIHDIVKAKRFMAGSLARLDRTELAEQLMREAHAQAYEFLPAGHPELVAADSVLAFVLQRAGKVEESMPYAQSALNGMGNDATSFGPHAGSVLSTYARALRASGDKEATENAYRKTYELMLKAAGDLAPNTGAAAGNLGVFLYAEGRLKEALPWFEKALEIQSATLPATHPTRGVTLYNLASLCTELGDLGRAEQYAVECLESCESNFGPDHRDTADAHYSLGVVRREQGHFEEAIEHFRFYRDFRFRRNGREDPPGVRTHYRLLACQVAQAAGAASQAAAEELESIFAELQADAEPEDPMLSALLEAAAPAFGERPEAAVWQARLASFTEPK